MDAPRERPRLVRFAHGLTIGRAVGTIASLALVLTLVAAGLVRVAEPETFHTLGEAAWWALQTVSTVGYGDSVPESGAGRALGAVLMLVGIAVVPAVTSIVVAVLVGRAQERVGANTERHADIVERLERLERALGERR